MATVILVIHLLLALIIIALVLMQRSEGGGLGIGGGGGLGSFATAGQTANALTRATAICAGLFFTTSLILAILAGSNSRGASMLDKLDAAAPAPVSAPATAGEKSEDKAGEKTPDTKTDGHSAVDKKNAKGDKEVPKAADKPQPQTGAPSAPISE